MRSSSVTQRSSVDLPPPDGPMMATTSPGLTAKRDVAQHLHVAEALLGVVDRDHGDVVA